MPMVSNIGLAFVAALFLASCSSTGSQIVYTPGSSSAATAESEQTPEQLEQARQQAAQERRLAEAREAERLAQAAEAAEREAQMRAERERVAQEEAARAEAQRQRESRPELWLHSRPVLMNYGHELPPMRVKLKTSNQLMQFCARL